MNKKFKIILSSIFATIGGSLTLAGGVMVGLSISGYQEKRVVNYLHDTFGGLNNKNYADLQTKLATIPELQKTLFFKDDGLLSTINQSTESNLIENYNNYVKNNWAQLKVQEETILDNELQLAKLGNWTLSKSIDELDYNPIVESKVDSFWGYVSMLVIGVLMVLSLVITIVIMVIKTLTSKYKIVKKEQE